MTWTIQSTDLRRRMRKVLDRVRTQSEAVIVRSYDTPQAVIIPYDDYQDFKEWQTYHKQRATGMRQHSSEQDHWETEFQALIARVQARTAAFSSDEIEADITLAAAEVKELRRARRAA